MSPKQKKKSQKHKEKKHSRRAAIEPVIGHLKQDYRLQRNFLKGNIGDAINLMLSAAAMNFKRVINLWLTEAKYRFKFIYIVLINIYRIFLPQYQKPTF